MNKTWDTVFDGTKTTPSSTWEPGREYRVSLMLQDGKGCMYVDGVLVGGSATIPTPETLGHEITHFYFCGGEGDINSSNVTVTKDFLYSRPLSDGEIKMVKKTDDKKEEKVTAPCVGGVSRVLLCGIVTLY
ncbi:trans-sialidase [Trypanosoma cruzi]|nr:trans-sialidase [Trypanosoma cruzi]